MSRTARRVPGLKGHVSWWIVVVAGTLVAFFAIGVSREVFRGQQVRQQVRRLQQKIAVEEERHTQLADLISYLSSQTFQEREARLKLGLKKPGERVLVVPGNNDNVNSIDGDAAQTTTGGTASAATTNPGRWWQYFFGAATLHKNA